MRLVAEGLTHRYGDRTVLQDANFSVRPGQVRAVIGPSGSGKTTLLALMGGLIKAQSGSAGVKVGDAIEDGRRHCSFILQTMNALGRRSALDNVALGALARGVSWEEARATATEALKEVGLAPFERRSARSLSGGELQRVVIARALVSDSSFVLADEPTGQLDRTTSLSVFSTLVTSCASRGVLVVTHDSQIASMCSDRHTIIDGRLEQV